MEATAASVGDRAGARRRDADDYTPIRSVGITIPLGPLGLTIGIYRHRVLALAVGLRRWMR